MSLKDRLPPDARRRLGRIKRAVLDQPEPRPKPKRVPAPPTPQPIAASRGGADYDRMEVRRQNIFPTGDRSGLFLEIGPAHNGTLPRRDGFDTRNVDYLDREGLVEKYSAYPEYDVSKIEHIDHVLAAGSTFSESIDETFDVVLASHVIEHSISMIDFINDLAQLVKPGGHIALVVPDHRFCYDRLRERASLSRVIDAHHSPTRLVHTPGTMAEFSLYVCSHRGTKSWAPQHAGKYELLNSTEHAAGLMHAAEGDEYTDAHNWVLSPNHLRLLLQDLYELGLISVRESHFGPTVNHEFFLNLSPDGPGSGLTREELLALADSERRILDPVEFE